MTRTRRKMTDSEKRWRLLKKHASKMVHEKGATFVASAWLSILQIQYHAQPLLEIEGDLFIPRSRFVEFMTTFNHAMEAALPVALVEELKKLDEE